MPAELCSPVRTVLRAGSCCARRASSSGKILVTTWGLATLWALAAALLLARPVTASPGSDSSNTDSPEHSLHWVVESRELPLFGWRIRPALLPDGQLWIGAEAEDGQALQRLDSDGKSLPTGLALTHSRAYALDAAPNGDLWFLAYSPVRAETMAGLDLHRRHGGQWQQQRLSPGIWPQAMVALSADELWIGGNGGRLIHLHHGRRRDLRLPPAIGEDGQITDPRNIHDMAFQPPNRLCAVGTLGLAACLHDGEWRVLEVPRELRRRTFHSLSLAPSGDLWIAGAAGLIAQVRDGQWRVHPTPTREELQGIQMLSPTVGWAVGSSGTILRYDEGVWRHHPSPTHNHLSSVLMSSEQEGWITGNGVLLRSQVERAPVFYEVTGQVHPPALARGATELVALDLDVDGRQDVARIEEGRVLLYRQRGPRSFEPLALDDPEQGLRAPVNGHGMAWGDVEGDGDPDLFLLAGPPGGVRLLLNEGAGSWSLAREQPWRGEASELGDTAYWLDLNRDGFLDLYWSRSRNARHSRLANPVYLSDPLGRWRQVTNPGGDLATEYFALWGDLDGDGDVDAVLPGYGSDELAFLRNEHGQLLEQTAASGLSMSGIERRIGLGELADLDLDGDLDLLFSEEGLLALFNDGAGRFTPLPEWLPPVPCPETGTLARGPMTADLDQDGRLEILTQVEIAGRRMLQVLSASPDGQYRDQTRQLGLADLRADAWELADLDDDGDLDLVVAHGRGTRWLENRSNGPASLKVRPRSNSANAQAIGTSLRLYTQGFLGQPGHLRDSRQVGLGGNRSSTAQTEALLSAAPGRSYDLLAIFPSGRAVRRYGVRAGQDVMLWDGHLGQRLWDRVRGLWLAARRGLSMAWLLACWLGVAVFAAALLRQRSRPLSYRFKLMGSATLVLMWLVLSLLCALGNSKGRALYWLPLAPIACLFSLQGGRAIVRRLRGARSFGPYLLYECIGEGAMAVVHRAVHRPTGNQVALKLLPRGSRQATEHRLRLLREAAVLRGLDNPHIVRVLDLGEIDGQPYLAMELLLGETLEQHLIRHGPVAGHQIIAWMTQLAAALAYLHQRGVLHRDLKGSNIFLVHAEDEASAKGPRRLVKRPPSRRPSGSPSVRLTDFGLAWQSDLSTLTRSRAVVGTLAYMAPELIQGGECTPSSDLYALGVTVYEAVCGELPFPNLDSLFQSRANGLRIPVPDHLPADLAKILRRLLAPTPNGRYRSARELLADLDRLAGTSCAAEAPLPVWPHPQSSAIPAVTAPASAELRPRWQELYRQASLSWHAGRLVEGQARLLDCLQALEEAMTHNSSGSLPTAVEVEEVLALQRRLQANQAGG